MKVDISGKMLEMEKVEDWRQQCRKVGCRVVATNGCFDIIHGGHITYLQHASSMGDTLIVGCNGDESVRRLKGNDRPINSEDDRALVLAALAMVDIVVIFPEDKAFNFLRLSKPDVYVKGGDYSIETLDSDERSAVAQFGGEIVISPLVSGKSTTSIIDRDNR